MSVHGTARWATRDEADDSELLSSSGMFVGFGWESKNDFEPFPIQR